uniref:Secreted protein n=1 Tax=Globodera pallida TaxID=36090 RepID=A0A183C5U4_GLOPA
MELHLGAFMDDFDGMTLRVLALDLLSAIGQNGTEWCKMKKTLFEMNAITATTDTLDKSFISHYSCVVSENGNLTDYSYVGNKTFFDFDCNQKFCKCLLEKLPAKAPKESPCLNHLYIICGEQQKAKGEIKVTTVTTATLGQKCYPGRLVVT